MLADLARDEAVSAGGRAAVRSEWSPAELRHDRARVIVGACMYKVDPARPDVTSDRFKDGDFGLLVRPDMGPISSVFAGRVRES